MNTNEIILSLSHHVHLHGVSVEKVLGALRSKVTTVVCGTNVACSNHDWHIVCTNNNIYGDKCIGYPCYKGATGELNVFQKTLAVGDTKLALDYQKVCREEKVIYRD